ncbi:MULTISPECIES: hypothetical protein [Brachybacterium]|uniref:Uncharacterized protein n=2 Tax=Brachybacterium TaxID=43668 RepID=A0A3R8QUJ0_9MICO|nr:MULTISPECIES: hypothetical protein [Brachybacterium]RRR18272.1 hypothetical protein DS079_11035 [Brachybacterium paraconglomeratum]GLI30381.1 hypothetical protein BCONGLO52_12220 [Brachybacterium conglomeratum]GLK04919.1 hypothetical protein GCM10017597_17190 [Brachybacterium conglomeratum]
MTSRKPRCPISPGGVLDDSRHCGRELGHEGPHRLPSGLEWGEPGSYIRHEKDELTLALVQQQRDQAVARAEKAEKRAALWKETARRAIRWRNYFRDVRDDLLRAHLVLQEELGAGATRLAESRPLTPDAITDEMLYRGLSAYYNIETTTARWDADRAEDFRRALAAALTEPPKRPEGAEEIERLLMDADRDGGEVYRTDGYTRLADYLAEGLSKGGARAPEDGAA